MALTPLLNRLPTPEGTEFPGTVDDFLQLIQEYMEITGLEDFNGINYGSVTPSEADRDKPWFKLSEAGVFLGWFLWDGSAWVLGPSYIQVGTATDRGEITSPQDGHPFYVVGTGLTIYATAEGGWTRAIPEPAAAQTYDRHYFYTSHQVLASVTSEVTSWTELDLSTYITDAGLTGYTIKAAIVRLEISQGRTGFANATYDATLRVTNDNGISTSATDVLNSRAFVATDDSASAGASTGFGFVPPKTGTSSIYYCVTKASSSVSNLVAKVWLTGFVYS